MPLRGIRNTTSSQSLAVDLCCSLFNDPLFSDVKIIQICGEKQVEYYGHRAILSANSRWFYNAFKGPYAVCKYSIESAFYLELPTIAQS
jgi:hypothetical protein